MKTAIKYEIAVALVLAGAGLLAGCSEPVQITSVPEGAQVFIGDDLVGITPLKAELDVCPVQPEYKIIARLGGYEDVEILARARDTGGRTYFDPIHFDLKPVPASSENAKQPAGGEVASPAEPAAEKAP